MIKAKPAIFLDRDGTLIHDKGYLSDPGKVVFYRNTFKALKLLQDRFELFIITNQSGIAKGLQSLEETKKVNDFILTALAKQGIKIRKLYFCPHKRGDGCHCMKPRPYFAHLAAADFGIALSSSFSIGDHPHDIEMARNFGGRGIYVLTGHGNKHFKEIQNDPFLAIDIWDATKSIMDLPAPKQEYHTAIHAGKVIREGGVAIIPTETVYGLGCNALDPKAAEQVFKLKRRPFMDPLIVHISSMKQLSLVSSQVPEEALKLANKYWPGPLTLILPKKDEVPGVVTAGLKTVAVRMPSHPVAIKIIRESGGPVAAPSANIFGSISPTTAGNAKDQLGDVVSCIVDGGPCEYGIESTIIDFSGKTPKILRPGAIPMDLEIKPPSKVICPGTMKRHYSPNTKLILNKQGKQGKRAGKIGRIIFGKQNEPGSEFVENLSPSGDLKEAAKNLYAALTRLDAMGLDLIVADLLPEEGIGKAVNDRLRRASAKRSQ